MPGSVGYQASDFPYSTESLRSTLTVGYQGSLT